MAGGSASRFGGDEVKQFLALRGRTVLEWSVTTARAACDGVVLVLPADRVGDTELTAGMGVDAVVAGGPTRSASVRAGMAQVPDGPDVEVVVVHDAARPLASAALFASVVDAVRRGADAAVPGVPVSDTIKRVAGEEVVATIDRSDLVSVQTPQAFRASVLRSAHAGGAQATDDAALVEAAGGRVVVVAGDQANLKITVPGDLALADAHLEARQGPGREPAPK